MRTAMVVSLAAMWLVGCDGSVSQPLPEPGTAPTPPMATTFAAVGTVYDMTGRPLDGASVEVVAGGTPIGEHRSTDASGRFAFDAVTDHLTVRASKPGYHSQIKSYGARDAAAAREFWIKLESDHPIMLTGDYWLTFTADPVCHSLPAAVRTRTYSGTIGMVSSDVLSLRGATFVQRGYAYNTVYLSQAGDFARFNFNDPEILERVTPQSYLRIYGSAEGFTSTSPARLPMVGRIDHCGQQSGADYTNCSVPLDTCFSAQHMLTVTRQ